MRTYNLFDVSIYTDYVCVTGSQLGLLGHLGQGTIARRGTVAPRYCSAASPLGFVG